MSFTEHIVLYVFWMKAKTQMSTDTIGCQNTKDSVITCVSDLFQIIQMGKKWGCQYYRSNVTYYSKHCLRINDLKTRMGVSLENTILNIVCVIVRSKMNWTCSNIPNVLCVEVKPIGNY